MSREIRLTKPCAHQADRERVFLGLDRMSLRTSKSIASQKGVRIFANDVEVPSIGLYSQAELFSSTSGPFRIIKNETDLVIQTSGERLQYSLPVSSSITTDALVKLLAGASSTTFFENSGGFLKITDFASFGTTSFVKVSGTATCSLGLSRQTGARGTLLYPGWYLEKTSDFDLRIAYRFPKFSNRLKNNPILKVNYTFWPEQCLRCSGSLMENDYSFNSYGDVILIENENLLHQAALKILLTTKGSNPYNPWYGSSLKNRIGSKAINSAAAQINEDVRTALEKMQSLQLNQRNYQEVSFKERLFSIQQVNTRVHDQDPTMFLVDVVVVNASQQPIQLTVVFTVPGVVAKIMGPDGLLKTF